MDILNGAGLKAAIVHSAPRFRASWFDNATRVVAAGHAEVGQRDIIVVGEIYGRSILRLPQNVRQVIFNQNVYNTLGQLSFGPEYSAPYIKNPALAMVLVVSRDNLDTFEYTFPGIPVRRLHLGLDQKLYHLPRAPKRRRVAYMPRKRRADVEAVLAMLQLRGVLKDWELVPIDGQSEADAAELLKSSQVFLSFSSREGFGLPPVEALACGCLVVGYHGLAGREYFKPPFAIAVEEGNLGEFARSVELAMRALDRDPVFATDLSAAGSRFVQENYSTERETADVLDALAALIG